MNYGNRGKYAEGKVQAWLKKRESASFTSHRFPDAHSGSMKTSPADFMCLSQGQMCLIEAKEVNHKYLLPYQNFDPAQVARMRGWQMAGAKAIVVVYFTPLDSWRWADVEWFLDRAKQTETGKAKGSWDMSDFELQPLSKALEWI